MSLFLLAVGVLLLTAAAVDVLWTTLWVEGGAGPLTDRLMAATWLLLRRLGSWRPGVKALAGPVILTLGIALWIALLWAGWALVFAGGGDVLRDTIDGGPISWAERFYFVGYTLFTMGNGDFAPSDGAWQVATAVTAASGMLFVTLIITYVLSVLDAVTQKRSFATGVSGLGTRGESVVRASWDGEGFGGVGFQLDTFTAELNELTANHKAYPILHYFYAERRDAAAVVSIAALDEALTLWRFGVERRVRPSDALLANARSTLETYLRTVGSSFVTEAASAPPAPDLEALRDAGIPTVTDEEFAAALEGVVSRRRTLRGLVDADEREWPGPPTEE